MLNLANVVYENVEISLLSEGEVTFLVEVLIAYFSINNDVNEMKLCLYSVLQNVFRQ